MKLWEKAAIYLIENPDKRQCDAARDLHLKKAIVKYGELKLREGWEPDEAGPSFRYVAHKAKCFMCGGREFLESHHIVPRAWGGLDIDLNIIPLCPNCHRKIHQYLNRYKQLIPKETNH